MSYSYKYIPAAIQAVAKKGTNPKQQYIDLFQETLQEQFYNASNWWTIQEETAVGSALYQNIDVRIAHVINAETGLNLGDDWKTVLFSDVEHPIELGKFYIFDNSTWLTINTEVKKNLTGTCTIRRCNNVLRWIDEPSGAVYEEPCAIDYEIKEPRDYATQGSPFMTPGGFIHIYAQLNARTALINENQRFLFGNQLHWTCYKVAGTGINDIRNMTTYDNDSARILTLDLIANFVNHTTDDIVNGIADVYTNVYTLSLSSSAISGSPTSTFQVIPYVTYNGDTVARRVDWRSSNTSVASVSGSDIGSITLNSIGTCVISACVHGNPTSATCDVSVTGSPTVNSEILISPNTNYVLEGDSRTYSVYLYENNVIQADTFTITCTGSDVPVANYSFTQGDGNHFTIANTLRSTTSYLTVQCTTGSVLAPKSFRVYLRGAWQFDNI